ncbi:MAG: uroporphyrinogen decarboxylase family protein [Candidatus Hodarchaeota archaeon]
MDAKDRIHLTLDHEEPDRVPVSEGTIDNIRIVEHYGEKYVFRGIKTLLGIFTRILPFKNRLIRKYTSLKNVIKGRLARNVKLYKAIGVDMAVGPVSLFPVKFYKWGYVDEFGRKFKVTTHTDGMDVAFYSGGYFKDFEEYESFDHHPSINDRIRGTALEIISELNQEFEGDVYVIPGFPALLEATWEGFGIENFSRLLTRSKEAKKVFDDRGKFALEQAKLSIEAGAEFMLLFDDYGFKTRLFMHPKNFEKYIFPWMRQICNYAHNHGAKILLHSCGNLAKIFEALIDCGIDAFNPIEPTVSDPDYDIFKLKKKYGDKITLNGNVSPQDLATKDPEYIINYTKKLLKECAPGGGYIIASGHSINPQVKLENFLAMRETTMKYGTYPIDIPD